MGKPFIWSVPLQVNQGALAVDVVESDVGPINKAALHLALTVAAFLVEDEVSFPINAALSHSYCPRLSFYLFSVDGSLARTSKSSQTFSKRIGPVSKYVLPGRFTKKLLSDKRALYSALGNIQLRQELVYAIFLFKEVLMES